ncbi:flagellin [Halocella sp. SP3-1]|uniref:flagellin N-terminal helical domain-containing protein n=1 Tax=Halocella sp. SP3-1 TaxID=2382161 RepID=UPI000F75CC49|nr:flagellin [Halocella sp. SP3-1]AZO94006.1 flagellin [Halocella sp. SP3-1]
MIINHNISSMNALRNLSVNSDSMSKTMEKLSSGYRINRAADDAAGLAISEKMRAQISGLNQAQRNAQDGISLIQTAEGALNEVHSMLRRMRDLSLQASTGTNQADDIEKIQSEVGQLIAEISGIAGRTEFNGMNLLNAAADVSFQIGSNSNQVISVGLLDMTATTGLSINGVDVTTDPQGAIDTLDGAISAVSSFRSTLGSVQNRLEHTIKNLATTEENLQASESRIRDADMAAQMADLTKNQILQQAGTAMLAQANTKSQSVLSLLG